MARNLKEFHSLHLSPESFRTVEVDLAWAKSFPVIGSQVTLPTKHQGVEASEFMLLLQDVEDKDFFISALSLGSLSSSCEAGLIGFGFPSKPNLAFSVWAMVALG